MHESINIYLELALEIEAEGKRNISLGSEADYEKMLSLMQQHIKLAKSLKQTSPFEKQVKKVSDLDRRLKNYRKTGLFKLSNTNE